MVINVKKRILSLFICINILVLSIFTTPALQVKGANKKFTVEMAKEMALMSSSDYELMKGKLALAKVQYDQSIKKLKLKEKNQTTFRWSPLTTFKLPEQPNLVESFEYNYEPLSLQSEIDKLNHEITDCVYEIYEKVSLQFVKVYILQEKIEYNEKRLEGYQSTLDKNRARLIKGEANKSDIEAISKKVETLENTIVSDIRSLEAQKSTLSNMVGIDLTSSYDFESPLVDVNLDRSMLDKLINYTLEHDDSYYQAETDAENGLIALNTNYDLMKRHYGADIYIISSFVSQAKSGETLNASAFKLKYNEFLTKIDEPWQGKKKIWFVKIPREWFKGAIDGVRYVEDEPYALYESAIEYQNLHKEQLALEKELTSTVTDYYENYISGRNTCNSLEKSVASKKEELQKSSIRNSLGQMTYEEYSQVQEEYENLQIDLLDAQASYSELIYSFDRLTCGAISDYLNNKSSLLASASGGESYIVANEGDGVYYYIHSLVAENMFEFGLTVSEDADVDVESYELWIDGILVGERTGLEYPIIHLALDIREVDRVFVRLYSGSEFIDDCDIDTTVYSGKLDIIKAYDVEMIEETLVATYTTGTDGKGLFLLNIKPEPSEDIAFFSIKNKEGKALLNGEKTPIKDTFRYLTILESSLEEMTICFYGSGGSMLYEAEFNTTDKTIHKKK